MKPFRGLAGVLTLLLITGLCTAWGTSAASALAQTGTQTGAQTGIQTGTQVATGTITTGRAVPRKKRKLYRDPTSAAVAAADADRRFAPIARRAQAMWLTGGTPAQARKSAADYARRADAAGRTPLLVLYAIPGRDCGQHSAGGLADARAYRSWVRAVARGLRGKRAMVVLEPDALAHLLQGDCTAPADRLRSLRQAVRRLSKAGAWVYLDAGHSGWHRPEEMARVLKRAGVARARGFATNVANYRPTKQEIGYAQAVVARLRGLGVGKTRYVVDTSRNGAGARGPAAGDWCNPSAARLGRAPKLVFAKGARRGPLDGFLWVKRPGESDGECNGGPAAGTWWPHGALSLLGRTPSR